MFKEISLLKKRFNKITFLSWVVFMGLNFGNSAIAQTPPPYVPNIPAVVYTPLEEYYSTGSEITCTAKVYSNGLIDKLCAIYYTIYKDDFNTPIPDVEPYGSVSYTVRSKGENYITQNITTGNGYLSVKPFISIYKAFTLGIFDNYCTNRNRPVALSMTFNVPGVYKFNAEIRSCTNGGSSILTNFTVPEGASEGCAPGSHSDKAASSCDNPTALTSDAIFLTICDDNYIAFLSGDTEYCPGEVINLVYTIGGNDDEVDLTLLPEWITPVINQNANTLTLTGVAPDYDPENPIINFDVRILSAINPVGCPGDAVNQSIMITKQNPLPVDLASFEVVCENAAKHIQWTTFTEVNNHYFTLEKSENGIDYKFVAQVQGEGNSNQIKHYHYLDTDLSSGIIYYRLIQTDFDGQEKVYEPVSSNCEKVVQDFNLFPNPNKGNFKISTSSPIENQVVLLIFDFQGKAVYQKDLSFQKGNNLIEINAKLHPGIYMVYVKDDNNSYMAVKMVVVN